MNIELEKYPYIYKYLSLFPDNLGLISHRGNVGSVNSEENNVDNSLSNIKVAATRGYIKAIEIDLRLVDDVVVASHEKIEPGSLCYPTKDLSYYYDFLRLRASLLRKPEQVRQFYEDKLGKMDYIATGEDIMNWIKNNNPNMGLYLEIKDHPSKLMPFKTKTTNEFFVKRAHKISELINAYKLDIKNIVVNSFDPDALRIVQDLTGVSIGIIVYIDMERMFDSYIKNNPDISEYSIMWPYLTFNFLEKMAEYNKSINVYTIDGLYRLNYICKKLCEFYCKTGYSFGCGIVTNVPDYIEECRQQVLKMGS